MTLATPPPPRIRRPPIGPLRTFTVDEYHRMIQTGVLGEDDPVELLEGWIVYKMPRKPPHDGVISLVDRSVRALLHAGWHVRIQSAVTTQDSEPEPDLAVVFGDERTHLSRHPTSQDVGLVVEVADTSLDRDRNDKGPIYARAGIAHYWIVNLIQMQVEVYSDPSGASAASAGYRSHVDLRPGDSVELILRGQRIGAILAGNLLP